MNGFHRRLLRQIRWPKTISNIDLYRISKIDTPWSSTIKQRRLNWLGHLMRLPEETSAHKDLEEVKRPEKEARKTPSHMVEDYLKKHKPKNRRNVSRQENMEKIC